MDHRNSVAPDQGDSHPGTEDQLFHVPEEVRQQWLESELWGGVQAAIFRFLAKRGGPDWLVRARDGTICAKLDGIFNTDELMVHIVHELIGREIPRDEEFETPASK
jgi:hypothetical protein